MGTHVSRDEHVACKHVALAAHVDELRCARERDKRSVAVGYEADALGTCAEASEAAEQADGGSAAPDRFAARTGNADAHHVGCALGACQRIGLDVAVGIDGFHKRLDRLAARSGRVEQFVQIEQMFEKHRSSFDAQSFGSRYGT